MCRCVTLFLFDFLRTSNVGGGRCAARLSLLSNQYAEGEKPTTTATLPSCMWPQRIFLSLPGSRLMFFFNAMQVQHSYSRSHAFFPLLLRHLATAFGSALFVADVDHPVRCVLCTVLHSFCTCNSMRRSLSAALVSALFALDVDHPVQGGGSWPRGGKKRKTRPDIARRRERQRDWESCNRTRKRRVLRSGTHWPSRRVVGILVRMRDGPRPPA